MLNVSIEKKEYRPGETLRGQVSGVVPRGPSDEGEAPEVRLFYYTEGKGTQDIEITERRPLTGGGTQQFSFTLPRLPWSVSGQLLSICWAVEAVCGEDHARAEFTLSPSGREITLGEPDMPSNKPGMARISK